LPSISTLIVGDQGQHHVAIDAQLLDELRFLRLGEARTQQRVDRRDVAAGRPTNRDGHTSDMSGASSAFMPIAL
jgi:hypothetical protein